MKLKASPFSMEASRNWLAWRNCRLTGCLADITNQSRKLTGWRLNGFTKLTGLTKLKADWLPGFTNQSRKLTGWMLSGFPKLKASRTSPESKGPEGSHLPNPRYLSMFWSSFAVVLVPIPLQSMMLNEKPFPKNGGGGIYEWWKGKKAEIYSKLSEESGKRVFFFLHISAPRFHC